MDRAFHSNTVVFKDIIFQLHVKVEAVWLEVHKPCAAGQQAEDSYASVCR